MKVSLKSNGTEHDIPSKVWDKMSNSMKQNYNVISNTDTVASEQVVDNSAEVKVTKKKKKEEEKEEDAPQTEE